MTPFTWADSDKIIEPPYMVYVTRIVSHGDGPGTVDVDIHFSRVSPVTKPPHGLFGNTRAFDMVFGSFPPVTNH